MGSSVWWWGIEPSGPPALSCSVLWQLSEQSNSSPFRLWLCKMARCVSGGSEDVCHRQVGEMELPALSLVSSEEPVHSPLSCFSVPADPLEAEERFEAADFGCQLQVLVPGLPTVQKMVLGDYLKWCSVKKLTEKQGTNNFR